MKTLVSILSHVENGAAKLKNKLKEKENLTIKLEFAINALKLIAHTTCPDHPDCPNATLLQNIAKDALDKL